MVGAFVEQVTIVRHEYKSALCFKIIAYRFSCVKVKAVGRLVYQQESVVTQKQQAQQKPCLFTARQRTERSVQNVAVRIHIRQLTDYLPLLHLRTDYSDKLTAAHILVLYVKRKVQEIRLCVYRTAVFKFASQQLQKCGLATSVPADKPRFPRCVKRERHILIHGFITAVIIIG